MVLSMSASSSMHGGLFGSLVPVRRRHFKLMRDTGLRFGMHRQNLQHDYERLLPYISQVKPQGWRNVRANVGWPFKGNNQGLDANSERSESANEDILMFFFQLDLGTRVQYALNLDQYDIAKQLREKLAEVEEEIIRQQQIKRGSTSKGEAQDMAITILRLRAEQQAAIESENYNLAAQLRDEISKLEAESLAATVKAQAYENIQYKFRLGQKVRHKTFGYRAVICGMDPVCCESKTWMETANVDKLSRGPDQPFYQVLVDVYMDPNLLVAYVAEENLLAPEQPDMVNITF
ncbi:OLC1v1032674C2 [Oldenlandia corymbosa var. corymbosa]|uniref:OLC1v1032674C2 n=1 Tax=Oldenlandia corymbosa var. corymbosa TaxID=529605 RepID=A0AAV1CPG3_OLDCO|nr:OLC1v1032674C2 [Oldenlandia corymbosa var. corymbosa]